MRGHPEEQPVLSRSRAEGVCVSEEGQSFRDGEKENQNDGRFYFFPPQESGASERGNC